MVLLRQPWRKKRLEFQDHCDLLNPARWLAGATFSCGCSCACVPESTRALVSLTPPLQHHLTFGTSVGPVLKYGHIRKGLHHGLLRGNSIHNTALWTPPNSCLALDPCHKSDLSFPRSVKLAGSTGQCCTFLKWKASSMLVLSGARVCVCVCGGWGRAGQSCFLSPPPHPGLFKKLLPYKAKPRSCISFSYQESHGPEPQETWKVTSVCSGL